MKQCVLEYIYIYTKGFKNKVLLLKTLHIKSYSLSKFQYVIFLIKEESNWDGPALVLSILQSWSLSCLRKTQSLRAAARALLSDLPLVQIPQQQSLLLYSFIFWGGTRLLTGKFRSGSNLSKGISSSAPPPPIDTQQAWHCDTQSTFLLVSWIDLSPTRALVLDSDSVLQGATLTFFSVS